MPTENKAYLFRSIIALALILEGAYGLTGVISTLMISHVLNLAFVLDILLIELGIKLWKNRPYTNGIACAYFLIALISEIVFKSSTAIFIPHPFNMLYAMGLVSKRLVVPEELTTIMAIAIFIRVIQLIFTLWLIKGQRDAQKRMGMDALEQRS